MNKTNPGVALVTGASSGIGYATAKALQKAGYRVFGTSRRATAEGSDGVTMLTCDVTDDASVAKLGGHGAGPHSAALLMADQQLAGLIMLVACPVVYLLAATVIVASWLGRIERRPFALRA